MSDIIREQEKRVHRYWTEDGLPDLYIGLSFIVYAALLTWRVAGAPGWAEFLISAFPILIVIFGRWLIEAAKQRVTYPRTGYVKYPLPTRRQVTRRVMASLIVAALLLAVTLFGFLHGGEEGGLLLIGYLMPLLFTFIIGVIAYRQNSLRYALYAVLAGLFGLTGAFLAPRLPSSTWRTAIADGAAILFPLGIAILIGGAWTFLRYLRLHPPREAE